jgi:type II secretory pathway pseudopilin PulG
MPHFNSRGTSLVEILVASGILLTLLVGITSILGSQWQEVRALNEKLAAADLEKLMIASLGDGAFCTHLATTGNLTFNASDLTRNPQTVNLGSILRAGPSPTAVPIVEVQKAILPSVVPQTIVLSEIQGLPSDTVYTAKIVVNFDNSKLVRAIKPPSASVTIRTSGNAGSKKIEQCMPPGAAGGGGGGALVQAGTSCDDGFGVVMYDQTRGGNSTPQCCKAESQTIHYINTAGFVASAGTYTMLNCN